MQTYVAESISTDQLIIVKSIWVAYNIMWASWRLWRQLPFKLQ